MNRKITVIAERIDPKTYDTHQIIDVPKLYMVRYQGKMIAFRHFNGLINNARVMNNDAVYVDVRSAKKIADKMNKLHRTDKFTVWCYDGQTSYEVRE